MVASKIKNFIIDTNVILYSPNCLETFQNNNIIIPAVVLEEVDSFKKNVDLNGYNARSFIRVVEDYRERLEGDLQEGVDLDSGGRLFVKFQNEKTRDHIPSSFDVGKNDNIILAIAQQVKQDSKLETIVVSKDVNLRIKANALGLDAEDYYHEKTTSFIDQNDDTLFVQDDYIDMLYQEKELPCPEGVSRKDGEEFSPRINEYFILKGLMNNQKSALVRYVGDSDEECGFRLLHHSEPILGITPANRKQIYLMDSLLDPDIDVVFAIGIAGTGKTLLALAAGLHSVLNERFKRLIVTRSPIPLGRDLGYLPGGITEKLDPWLKPIYDNMEFIVCMMDKGMIETKDNFMSKSQMHDTTIDYLKSAKMLEIEALTYIRGRTLMDTYLVVDEAQNLSPHEIKTIITRAGMNSKLVFTGDLKQIDNPYLNERDNGLVNASEKFTYAGFKHASTIYLDKGERSRLATVAAEIL